MHLKQKAKFNVTTRSGSRINREESKEDNMAVSTNTVINKKRSKFLLFLINTFTDLYGLSRSAVTTVGIYYMKWFWYYMRTLKSVALDEMSTAGAQIIEITGDNFKKFTQDIGKTLMKSPLETSACIARTYIEKGSIEETVEDFQRQLQIMGYEAFNKININAIEMTQKIMNEKVLPRITESLTRIAMPQMVGELLSLPYSNSSSSLIPINKKDELMVYQNLLSKEERRIELLEKSKKASSDVTGILSDGLCSVSQSIGINNIINDIYRPCETSGQKCERIMTEVERKLNYYLDDSIDRVNNRIVYGFDNIDVEFSHAKNDIELSLNLFGHMVLIFIFFNIIYSLCFKYIFKGCCKKKTKKYSSAYMNFGRKSRMKKSRKIRRV